MKTDPGTPLSCYRGAPFSARAHVAVRWRLLPFPSLLAHAPAAGEALDLGCGHGLFSLLLATARPGLQVLGVDPDQGKIAVAQAAARAGGIGNLRFLAGKAEALPLPPCVLISLIDVLYLIPYEAQERLLQLGAERLQPGGRLLIKEMSTRPRWKYLWNLGQESLSVRLLGITYGRDFYFREDDEWRRLLTRLGLEVEAIRLDAGRPHPHLLLCATRPR